MSSLSAVKLDLSDPDKFQLASVVTKNSRLGISSNKRLLIIKKGYLYYYSNVPKKFKGDSSIVQTIHQLPKCSIQIVSIKQIKGYESNSSYFSIEFDEKNMLQRQDIRKTMTLEEYNFSPKNSKETIVWQFTCDNQFIKQRWVAALQGLRDYYNKEKKDIEKFFNQHKDKDNNSEMKSSSSGGRNSHVPWRQSQSGNNNNNSKKSNDVNYLQLVATKSNDERAQDRSLQPDNKYSRQNQLILPGSTNSPSRVRGNSSNNEQKSPSQFMKQYSPNEPKNKGFGMGSTISVSSSQEDLQIPNSISNPNNNIQNSPINQLQLSDLKMSPTKQTVPPSNMMFSKTQKVKISSQMIQEDENQSIRTPGGPSPVKRLDLDEISGYEKEGEEFETNLLSMEGQNTKSQPNIQTNFDGINKGLGMFHEINKEKQSPSRAKKGEIVNQLIQINLDDDLNPKNNKKQTKKQQQVTKPFEKPVTKNTDNIQSHSFYSLHKYLFQSSLLFQQRICFQQQFHKRIHQFSSQCINQLKDYVESLSSNQSSITKTYKLIYKTNNYTIIKHNFTKTLFKLAFVTSQSLSINGEEKIYFDEEAVKNLKREFKVYSDLEKYLVLGNLKSDNGFRLRVPLISLVEYKGVVALVLDQSLIENDDEQQQTSISKSNNLSHQMAKTYHKQIEALKNEDYDPKDFSFIMRSQNQNEQPYLILNLLSQIVSSKTSKQQAKKTYLKRLMSVKRPQKHHNLQFDPPFTHQLILKAHQTHASTSIQSLEQYIYTLSRIQEFQGICPKEEIIEILKICVFCKQIRKIYRSAQGQIQQTHFLNLVLKQDPQMMKILQQSGCDQIPPLKGVFFNFINHYLGIKCSVNQKALKDHLEQQNKPKSSNKDSNSLSNTSSKAKKADIVQSTQIRPKVQTYDISRIELVQAYESMRKFIYVQKTHLATQTLKIIQNFHLQQFPQLNHKQLEFTYFQSSLAYMQDDYLKCIQHCKQYQRLLNNQHDPKIFEVFLLMLKSYSHFSDDEFRNTFEKIIKLIQFNYGPSNSVFISVYSISAFFFYQTALKSQHNPKTATPLYLLSFKLIDQAQKLCLKLFGQTSSQYVDILMDSARLYKTKDRPKSQKYLDRARTVIISTQNNQKLVEYFLYQLKLTFSLKQFEQCQKLLNQCEELIHMGKFKLDTQKSIAVMRIKFELGIVASDKNYLSEQAVEQLWRSERMDEKRQAVILAAKLTKKLKLIKERTQMAEFQQSQSYLSSSISSQSFDNFVHYKDSVVGKIINLVLQSQYPQGYLSEEGLMTKIREILQDEEGEELGQNKTQNLSSMLQQIV